MDSLSFQRYRLPMGKKIRELRERQGYSLRTFSSMVGMDYTHLFNIEHGKISPTVDMLVKIADGLGVDPTSLIDKDLL